MLHEASSKAMAHTPPLDFCHDIYCDSDTYQVCHPHSFPYSSQTTWLIVACYPQLCIHTTEKRHRQLFKTESGGGGANFNSCQATPPPPPPTPLPSMPLHSIWLCLSPPSSLQKMQLERVLLHESKRYTYELTKKCADALLFLGQVCCVCVCVCVCVCGCVFVCEGDHTLQPVT